MPKTPVSKRASKKVIETSKNDGKSVGEETPHKRSKKQGKQDPHVSTEELDALQVERESEEEEEVDSRTESRNEALDGDEDALVTAQKLLDTNEQKKSRQIALAKRFGEKLAKRGVVYMSRVPPYMRPEKVKHLLGQFGEITRIYLVQEDASIAKRRKKLGGNRTAYYVEGWIEFADKKVAKSVARSLNNTQIGGKKRGFYREDIWNLKYLKHFTWSHLTEKKAYERRVQEHKLKLEMVTAKKQNEEFKHLVEKGKIISNIERKKAAKRKPEKDDMEGDSLLGSSAKRLRRQFRQNKPVMQLSSDGKERAVDDGVLSKVVHG